MGSRPVEGLSKRYLGKGPFVFAWAKSERPHLLARVKWPHHSITSSAQAIRVAGSSKPSALAVFRLMTSSYLLGAWTGRSAGFFALQYAIYIVRGAPVGCDGVGTIGDHPTAVSAR